MSNEKKNMTDVSILLFAFNKKSFEINNLFFTKCKNVIFKHTFHFHFYYRKYVTFSL